MRRSSLLMAAVLWIGLIPAPAAHACSCADMGPEWLLTNAAVAFVGTPTGRVETANERNPVRWTFSVERYLKGSGGPTIAVETGRGDADCGVDFSRTGRTAVLAWQNGGVTTTDSCGGVWDVDELVALAGPGVPPTPDTPAAVGGSGQPAVWPWVVLPVGGLAAMALLWTRRRSVPVAESDGWSGGNGTEPPPS